MSDPLPRCGLTDLPRLWCEHCLEAGFSMTPEERAERARWLDRAGEPPSLPLAPRDTRPGIPLPEYESRPLFSPGDVTFPDHGASCRVPKCDRPAGDQYLCNGCLDDCERYLADIPRLIPDLEVHAYGQVRFAGGGGAGDGVRGMSRASELIHQVHAELVSAVRHLTEERGLLVDLPDDTDALAGWLLAHARSVALDPAGPDILTGLERWHSAALRAIDRPPDREYIGLCDKCSTPLHAPEDAAEYACPTCRRVHSVAAQRERIARRLSGATATVGELAILCKISRHRINGWVRRGMVLQVGRSDPARYPVDRVMELIAEFDQRRRA